MLSPHPDDLVFSCFSAMMDSKVDKRAIVFFNSSKFSRWPIHSKKLISFYRTLEDKFILESLGIKVKYLFNPDTSIENPQNTFPRAEWDLKLDPPLCIYSPLGVGGNKNHIQVRDWAIRRWIGWNKNCELCFYEDLPYAAKLGFSPDEIELPIIRELESICESQIELQLRPLSREILARKILLSKFYFSQTDYSELLESFAKIRGRSSQAGFAETIYHVRRSK
jgi:hypothetical protein